VIKTEEKRSDVNLATLLLVDCFENDFEQAAVVSNDSDLALPIEQVNGKFGKPVISVNPHSTQTSRELESASSAQIRKINKKVLALSQFPETLTDVKGTFRRPARWA
jgi:hypothetical protein